MGRPLLGLLDLSPPPETTRREKDSGMSINVSLCNAAFRGLIAILSAARASFPPLGLRTHLGVFENRIGQCRHFASGVAPIEMAIQPILRCPLPSPFLARERAYKIAVVSDRRPAPQKV